MGRGRSIGTCQTGFQSLLHHLLQLLHDLLSLPHDSLKLPHVPLKLPHDSLKLFADLLGSFCAVILVRGEHDERPEDRVVVRLVPVERDSGVYN